MKAPGASVLFDMAKAIFNGVTVADAILTEVGHSFDEVMGIPQQMPLL